LTSVTSIGNYTSKCDSDSQFKVDIAQLQQSSLKCKSKGGNVKDGNYLWFALFVKNDARNVIEWVVWHLLLGADHIVIYDNNSSDNLAEALLPLVNANLISRIIWDGIGIGAQQASYRDAIQVTKDKNISWLALIDTDEFILPLRDKCLPTMLSRFDDDQTASAVILNWRMMPGKFELSHRTTPYEPIFERTNFTLGYPNRHIKTILKPSMTEGLLTAHAAFYSQGTSSVSIDSRRLSNDSFNDPPEVHDAVILHYHAKSLEEWVAKKNRWKNGMNAKRCPACHEKLEGIVIDWLNMKNSEIHQYNQTYHRHCDSATDESTVTFMKENSAILSQILSYA
jgi:hypothetical protein